MKNVPSIFLTIALIASTLPGHFVNAQDSGFKLRGSGDNFRKEGLGKENVGAHFSLISVTRGENQLLNKRPSELAVKFFVPNQATAYLRIREKVSIKTYKLDAEKTVWSGGWNTFGPWPLDEVIYREGVAIDNLGITVTQRTTPHASGTVYPSILLDGKGVIGAHSVISSGLYSFIVKSNTGLEPFKWALYKISPEGSQAKLSNQEFYIEKLAAGVPYEIKVNTWGFEEGDYKIKMRGEYITSDYSKVVKKSYKFYHKVN